MIHILWEFKVRADRVDEFLRHYSSDGTWAQLFRKSAAFKETVLMRDAASPLRFVTLDTWEDQSGFEDFKQSFRSEYEAIDRQCEALTQSENLIGIFETVSLE
jgi:quinol monooxygenase YgiN